MPTKSPGRRSKEFSVEFDQAKLNQLFTDLERNIGAVALKDIVRGEAAAVLLTAAKRTGKATIAKIKKAAGLEKRARYLSQGGRWITRNDKLLAKRQAVLAEKLKRVGGAKDGWLSIIRQMKLKPANANQRKGLTTLMGKKRPTVDGKPIKHLNTAGREITRGKGSYAIEVRYGNPVGRWARASSALRSAVHGRKTFFRKNLKEGVFFSARDIAKKYPGIKINKQ